MSGDPTSIPWVRTTPQFPGKDDLKMDRFYEASVLRQGDRLLKEMLQLRRDLEKDKLPLDFAVRDVRGKEEGLLPIPNYGPLKQGEENLLREKLEMMTLQIKREMEEEFKKQQSKLEFAQNEDDDSKIKKIFKNILVGKFVVLAGFKHLGQNHGLKWV